LVDDDVIPREGRYWINLEELAFQRNMKPVNNMTGSSIPRSEYMLAGNWSHLNQQS
jgi:hypothetical protein